MVTKLNKQSYPTLIFHGTVHNSTLIFHMTVHNFTVKLGEKTRTEQGVKNNLPFLVSLLHKTEFINTHEHFISNLNTSHMPIFNIC